MATEIATRSSNGPPASAEPLLSLSPDLVHRLVVGGDLGALSPQQQSEYYVYRARAMGLDPAAKPFEYLKLNGKTVLYATKSCTDQLVSLHRLSVTITETKVIEGVYAVTAKAARPDGSAVEDIGAATIKGLQGEALANGLMKATTKAKRRAVLSLCGLGMLDETEVSSIPAAEPMRQVEGPPPQQRQRPGTLPSVSSRDREAFRQRIIKAVEHASARLADAATDTFGEIHKYEEMNEHRMRNHLLKWLRTEKGRDDIPEGLNYNHATVYLVDAWLHEGKAVEREMGSYIRRLESEIRAKVEEETSGIGHDMEDDDDGEPFDLEADDVRHEGREPGEDG